MLSFQERLHAELREAGMRGVPEDFSVAPIHQEIPRATMAAIDAFVRVFDGVTTRPAWQAAVTASTHAIARRKRPEVCFFSAWDFHVPTDRPDHFQLIECNDNGSGLLVAALLNRIYYEMSGLGARRLLETPPPFPAFAQRVAAMVRAEAERFFGAPLPGLVLILDDAESLRTGKFRDELVLLRARCRRAGWSAELGAPDETTWDGKELLWGGERVAFVVNRSTDFFWEAESFAALRAAYADASVFIAPNPFTYATRSDKRLLELLSSPLRDAELGIAPEERAVLRVHVPETRLLRPENVEDLAREKEDLFFKPCHGFASHGVLTGDIVGRERLRRLLRKGEPYVAQRRAPKARLNVNGGVSLWTDLRVWAYRGERFLVSGRGSLRPDGVDLSSPGGWVATYAEA